MDITSLLSTFMSGDSVSGLSSAANVSADSTKSILSAALPSLLSGAVSQSADSETAEGFAAALTQHAASDTSNLSSFLSGIDLDDGGKIISHLLGGKTDSTVSQIAEQTGTTAQETSSVLSAAAPMLMSLLGQQTGSAQAAGTGIADIMSSLMGNTDLTSVLSGLMGGSGNSAAADVLTEVTEAVTGASSDKKSGLLGSILGLFKK